MTRTRKILIGAAAVVASATGAGVGASQCNSPAPSTTVAVPSTIASNCSTDVSAALDTFFASVPAGDTVDFPANGCYLVSNTVNTGQSPDPDLFLGNLSNLTIVGNGTTLHQTSYGDNTCSTDDHQPILQLTSDTGLTFSNLTIEGPGECGGANTEGGAGIYLGKASQGNTHITFDNVTLEDTAGDGVDIYPDLGTCCGINTDVTFTNGAMNHIGYHAFVPEGVTGLTITGNTFTNVGDFMDLEIDNNVDAPFNTCNDTYAEGLTGNAQCNITISDNHFVSSNLELTSVSNGQCIPMGNMVIDGNQMDANSTFSLALMGSGSTAADDCPQDTNLQIESNVEAVCTPVPGTYVGCGTNTGEAIIQIATWNGVTIVGNQVLGNAGAPEYGANTLKAECIAVAQSASVGIVGNVCNNTNNVWDAVSFQFQPHSSFTNTNVASCGDTYGLTDPMYNNNLHDLGTPPAAPQHDANCGF